MKKAKYIAILAILATALLAGCFFLSHIFVGGSFYPKNRDILYLQDRSITAEQYDSIHEKLPDCDILWNVPFQGTNISSHSRELTVADLTEADLDMLSYFPVLEKINVENCTNYQLLSRLSDQRPNLDIQYTVTIDGTTYPHTAESITISSISDEEIELLAYLPALTDIDAQNCNELDQIRKLTQQASGCTILYYVNISGHEVLSDTRDLKLTGVEPLDVLEAMPYLPGIESVELKEPAEDFASLAALCQQYPNVEFHWELDILGIPVSTEDTEVDLSGAEIPSAEYVESVMACFPNLEKVYLGECGLDNDELAAYRDRVREDYKVAWLLRLGLMPVRTDATYVMPGKPHERYYVTDKQAELLRYCEDMICVDLGHYLIYHCEWVRNMPNLRYLILADTPIVDISPISSLKNLVFLELFGTYVEDYSPLVECTALDDLNLGYTEGKTADDIKKMTWLKRLWWADAPVSEEEMREALPNTEIRFQRGSSTGFGWREGQHYYDMRDLLEMYYMTH
ncbi:MAG: hypothetical protein IKU68_04395 [Oscillospiraceae bacterium]|nr:hypothetical protein [Oscillospiraceae bacterium]